MQVRSNNNNMETILRVNQLDACELDETLANVLQHQFIEIIRPFQSIRIQKFIPELKAFVRFLIWRYSVGDGSSTFGQGMLDMMYTSSPSAGPITSLHKVGLFIALVLVEWLSDRSDWLTARSSNPVSAQRVMNWLVASLKLLSLLNLVMFFVHGRYPTLKERLLGLSMAPTRPQQLNSVAHSYLTREILWHGFSEFVFFILPHFNIHSVQNWMRRLCNTTTKITSNSTCAFCGAVPTMPHLSDCGHIYCYYCLKANLKASHSSLSCFACSEIVHSCIPASEAIS